MSTVRKSQARTLEARWSRKARQEERVRPGAGVRPAPSSTWRTEVAETLMPAPLSSPAMRRYPDVGSCARGWDRGTEPIPAQRQNVVRHRQSNEIRLSLRRETLKRRFVPGGAVRSNSRAPLRVRCRWIGAIRSAARSADPYLRWVDAGPIRAEAGIDVFLGEANCGTC